MRNSVGVIDCFDGDGGKGKYIDFFVSLAAEQIRREGSLDSLRGKPIVVRRFQGGANAGHTIVDDNGTIYKLHQVPSGILTPEAYNLAGKGMFLNPRKLTKEILTLQAGGVDVSPDNFGVAANAHVTLDYHILDDRAAFTLAKHTSTGSGIKQTAVDKYGRVGLRFIEFLDPELMTQILRQKRFPRGMPKKYGESIERLVDSYDAERAILAPYVVMEHQMMREHGAVLSLDEGANGAGLDVDDGLYDGITSSHPARVPRETNVVVGVLKLYKSSVGTGNRPFVARIADRRLEAALRDAAGERGTTTGKDRELGWFDIPAARYAIDVCDVDHIVGTRGDSMEVFARVDAKPQICVAYDVGGKKYDAWDVSFLRRDTLYKAKPVLEEFEPWDRFVEEDGITLTQNAAVYLRRIEQLLGKQFSMLGTGARRKDMIVYDEII